MTHDFDPDLAEQAIDHFLETRGYGVHSALESRTPGVVAFERIDDRPFNSPRLRWDELAAHVVRETGFTLICIANTDWSVDDDCDQEATFFAFDAPGLDDDYRDDYRNLISAMTPAEAPTPEDFAARGKAETFVAARVKELKAKLEYVTGTERTAAEDELSFLGKIGEVDAIERDLVQALAGHDVAAAMDALNSEQAAATPSM